MILLGFTHVTWILVSLFVAASVAVIAVMATRSDVKKSNVSLQEQRQAGRWQATYAECDGLDTITQAIGIECIDGPCVEADRPPEEKDCAAVWGVNAWEKL